MATVFIRGILPGADYAATFQKSRFCPGYSFSPGLGLLSGASHPQDGRRPQGERHRPAAIIAIRTVLNYFLLRDIESHHSIINQPFRSGLRLTLLERR